MLCPHFSLCLHCIICMTLQRTLYQHDKMWHDWPVSCRAYMTVWTVAWSLRSFPHDEKQLKHLNYFCFAAALMSKASVQICVGTMWREETEAFLCLANTRVNRLPPRQLAPPCVPDGPVAEDFSSARCHLLQHEIWELGWSFGSAPSHRMYLNKFQQQKLIQARVGLSIAVSDCMCLQEQLIFPTLCSNVFLYQTHFVCCQFDCNNF